MSTVSKPIFQVPPLACDCHAHCFGPSERYPLVSGRHYDPPAHATIEAYRQMHGRLGIGRGVLVQPSPYGTDNSCLVDLLRALGESYRGVAVFGPEVSEDTLDRMHKAGVRGVRIDAEEGLGLDVLEPLAARIAGRGWHVQIFVADSADMADLAPRVRRLPVACVFDHVGRAKVERGTADPGFRALLGLVGDGTAWVKLSWAQKLSKTGPPFTDVDPLAKALIAANPERAVWGTDWPHSADAGAMPDDAELLSLVGRWAPDTTSRQKILVDNPAKLYGFGST